MSEEQRHALFAGCQAFLFPGEEDFGIAPLEAMAAGRPVVAFHAGGACETVIEGVTGRFFRQPTAAAFAAAIAASRYDVYDADAIRRHAEHFGRDVFAQRMRAFIQERQWTMGDRQ